MVGLHLLKHVDGLSDEAVYARYLDSPYAQLFCGETHFQHALPLDRSSMTRWLQRIGPKRLEVSHRRWRTRPLHICDAPLQGLPQGKGDLLVRVPLLLHGALLLESECPKKLRSTRTTFRIQDHSLVGRPILHPVAGLRDAVAAAGIMLEGHA
ncbi:transposase [Siccirubricoccus sp. KC 17139]|uniref:Transposase n=1 Tax=Siccirubricoccus soli TaxID=2899147 RepID=A0ABT1D4J0_9PROT|nr:transposase [Siccirubricoccus soli]MCO6416537.1 transposase [Siccirubricoccus soli]MCP2682672.1 transposase [Siccirubricoccus soli]